MGTWHDCGLNPGSLAIQRLYYPILLFMQIITTMEAGLDPIEYWMLLTHKPTGVVILTIIQLILDIDLLELAKSFRFWTACVWLQFPKCRLLIRMRHRTYHHQVLPTQLTEFNKHSIT